MRADALEVDHALAVELWVADLLGPANLFAGLEVLEQKNRHEGERDARGHPGEVKGS